MRKLECHDDYENYYVVFSKHQDFHMVDDFAQRQNKYLRVVGTGKRNGGSNKEKFFRISLDQIPQVTLDKNELIMCQIPKKHIKLGRQ